MSTQENVESTKKGPPPEKGEPPNFTVAYLVPLFLYFFAAFKLYMGALMIKVLQQTVIHNQKLHFYN